MVHGSKEHVEGAARIILNNLDEFLTARQASNATSTQKVLESNDWVHVYNLMQRLLFVNTRDVHFGVLGELERISKEEAPINDFFLRYNISSNGIIIHFVESSDASSYIDTVEVWCLDRAIQGLKLNMPSSIEL